MPHGRFDEFFVPICRRLVAHVSCNDTAEMVIFNLTRREKMPSICLQLTADSTIVLLVNFALSKVLPMV